MQVLNVAGAKKRLAPWIISHFPPHQVYVEPFGGSGAVLLAKERAPLEIYNDIDRELVLFFQTLAQRPEELLKAVDGSLYCSLIDDSLTEDTVELARRIFQRSNTTWTHSGAFKSQRRVTQADRTVATVFEERKRHLHTVAQRIRGVIFECRDGIEVIEKYDGSEVLFYVDPPYFGTRKANLYQHEMMDEESHRRLAAVLRECRGDVVLSGYGSALYKELYGDWSASVGYAQTNAKDLRQECLWIKPPKNGESLRPQITSKLTPQTRARIKKRAWREMVDAIVPANTKGGQVGKKHRPHKKKRRGLNGDNPRSKPHLFSGGNDNKYLIAKLKRDRPDIAERLANGEFRTVAAAAREAGFKLPSDRVLGCLRCFWRKATDQERQAFLAEIGAEIKS